MATATSALSSLISCCGSGEESFDQANLSASEKSLYFTVLDSDECHFLGPDQARLLRTTSNPDFSSWTVLCFILGVYLTVAVIANLVACYKFITTWNLIVNERRLDLSFFKKLRRRPTLKEALRTHVTIESMACSSCCICLSDFEENELVTSCDDGCHKWFHRECLFNWLDQSNDCPCCRIDMLSQKSRGVLVDLMEFVGFNPDS
ncbi:hypothetical protein ACA910_018201 [Epithemia clementina (nom. ined.)]